MVGIQVSDRLDRCWGFSGVQDENKKVCQIMKLTVDIVIFGCYIS